jgi:hypothetical protein
MHSGNPNTDEPYKWTPGFPAAQALPQQVNEYLEVVLFPQFQKLLNDEQNKEVVEKCLECIRDLADEMGPAAFNEARLKIVFKTVIELL